jgi:hypothetical protein
MNPDPDTDPDPGVDDHKLKKYSWKKIYLFFIKN